MLLAAVLAALSSVCVAEDSVYAYQLPFRSGNQFLVSQGFFGYETHTTPLSEYAVDITMPEGEPVCAAREGEVADMYDGVQGQISHYVHILHPDGTFGDYEHLQSGSITVKPGQKVGDGECFARVGSTGNSTGPHLHFAVLSLASGGWLDRRKVLVSIPFQFVGTKGRKFRPEYLSWLEK
jgi:murein DD-endopeptidase MepM/ murein hydrolase activator NlpD